MARRVPAAKVSPPRFAALERQRVLKRLEHNRAGFRLVWGPAGTGKTTALMQLAHGWKGPVVWLTADASDRPSPELVASLWAAVGSDHAASSTVHDVIAAIESMPGEPLVVIDDVHELGDSAASKDLELLARYVPSSALLAFGTRHLRGLDLWRVRTTEAFVEIGPEQLRFRLWEVAELYQNIYNRSLTADELHPLTTATDGWAAALHLYHVASRDIPADARRSLLGGLRLRSRHLRDYLTHQVLASIGPDDRPRLRELAIMDRLRVDDCRELFGDRAVVLLKTITDLGLVVEDTTGDSFHMHDLLRSHLLTELAEQVGEDAVEDLHVRAALVLESSGRLNQAVRSYVRGSDWFSAARLLAKDDPDFALSPRSFSELPRSVQEHDPWASRALARRLLLQGDLQGARDALRRVLELAVGPTPAAAVQDLRLLDGWLDPPIGTPTTWTGRLRSALASQHPGNQKVERGLGGVILAALTNRVGIAERLVRDLEVDVGEQMKAALLAALSLGQLISGDDPTEAALASLSFSRSTGMPAVERLADGLIASATGAETAIERLAAAAEADGDAIGAAVQGLIAGYGNHRNAAEMLRPATATFADLGLHGLAAMAQACLARLSASAPTTAWPERVSDAKPSIEITCIGRFEIRLGGDPIDLSVLRPLHLKLLQYLSLRPNQWVHRDRIVEAFWPGIDAARGNRNLQVAISCIRKCLQPDRQSSSESMVDRSGERYRLNIPEEGSDLTSLAGQLEASRRPISNPWEVEEALRRIKGVVDHWGPIMPGAGATEWIDEVSDHMARALGSAMLELGGTTRTDPFRSDVASLAAQVVKIDRSNDALWRFAISAARTAEAPLLARQLEQEYRSLTES